MDEVIAAKEAELQQLLQVQASAKQGILRIARELMQVAETMRD